MKIERLHYFETYEIFQGHKRYKKLGFEVSFDDEIESTKDVYYKLQRLSEELFYESKAAAEKQMGTHVNEEVSKIGNIIQDIESCKELKVLESYQMLVKNKPDLQEAYNNKFSKLKNQTT